VVRETDLDEAQDMNQGMLRLIRRETESNSSGGRILTNSKDNAQRHTKNIHARRVIRDENFRREQGFQETLIEI
jgi:hypothetical protein